MMIMRTTARISRPNIETINAELIFADIDTVEKATQKMQN